MNINYDDLIEYINQLHEIDDLEKIKLICNYINDRYGELSVDKLARLLNDCDELWLIINRLVNTQIDNKIFNMLIKAYNINNCNLDVITRDEYDSFNVYMNSIRNIPILTWEEEKYYGNLAKNGDKKATDHLVKSNLKLVVNIVLRYIRRNGESVPRMDLISEGNLGLMRAATKYDPSYNTRFSTYAFAWIEQYIAREIQQKSRIIRLPAYKELILKKYKSILYRLSNIAGRDITLTEAARVLNLTLDEVQIIKSLNKEIVSLNSFVGDDETTELGEFIPSDEVSVEDIVELKSRNEELEKIISKVLMPREQEIINYLYRDNLTLEAIGKKYNITYERVRQLQYRAIRKLRNSKKIINLVGTEYLSKKDNKINSSNAYNEIKFKDLMGKIDKIDKDLNVGNITYENIINDEVGNTDINPAPQKINYSYSDLLEFFENNKLGDLNLNLEQIIIVCLKNGYGFSNRCYSFNEIASYLNLSEDYILQTYKNIPSEYKEKIYRKLNIKRKRLTKNKI